VEKLILPQSRNSSHFGTRNISTASQSPLLVSILSHINSVYAPSTHPPIHPFSWRSSLMLSSRSRLGPSSGFLPTCLPTKTQYLPFLSPIRATRPIHLIILDLITRMICGEEHNRRVPH